MSALRRLQLAAERIVSAPLFWPAPEEHVMGAVAKVDPDAIEDLRRALEASRRGRGPVLTRSVLSGLESLASLAEAGGPEDVFGREDAKEWRDVGRAVQWIRSLG